MKDKNTASKACEINKKIRRQWTMNPVTRIRQNDRKNTKKRRQKEDKMIKNWQRG